MKVKIVLKDAHRVSAVKELRMLTGCGLKEAVDMIPAGFKVGHSFEVEAYAPYNKNLYSCFDIIDPSKFNKNEVVERLKVIICECIDKNEFSWAKTLIKAIEEES